MEYRREVDGLRAIAVVPVLLFHAGVGAFRGGFVGVDVFFVISGFLITSIILGEHAAGRFTLVGFYERRARRILPPLLFVMLCCLPAAWRWMPPDQLKDFAQSLAAVALFGSNLLFMTEGGYFTRAAEYSPLLHTWSLAVEEQYYLLFPLLLGAALAVASRRRVLAGLLVVAALSLGLAHWAATALPAVAFYGLPTRAWELLVGAALAFAPARAPSAQVRPGRRDRVAEVLGAGGLLAIAVAVLTFDEGLPFPGLYATLPVFGAALAIRYARSDTCAGALLGSRPLVAIGLVSYSLYLWHQPLLAFARVRGLEDPPAWVLLLAIGAALPLAWLTWRFVEAPFRDRKRVSRLQVFALSGAGLAVFAGLGVGGHVTDGAPGRFEPAVYRLLAFGPEHRQRRDGACNAKGQEILLPACRHGATGVAPDTALWGDSFAASLVEPLADAFRAGGATFVQYTKNACSPAIGIGAIPHQDCTAWNERVADEIAASPVRTVILFARWQAIVENTPFDNGEGGRELRLPVASDIPGARSESGRLAAIAVGWQRVVGPLLDAGKRVVLVYPAPEAGWQVPTRMARSLMTGAAGPDVPSTALARAVQRAARSERLLDGLGAHPRLLRVHPREALCDRVTRRCRTADGAEPLYYDTAHLSPAGARPVVELIVRAIEPPAGLQLSCGPACLVPGPP